jgi:flagellar motor switch protein FliM
MSGPEANVAEPLTPEEIDALLNSLKESTSSPVAVEATPEPEVPAALPSMPFGELSRDTAEKLSSVAESLKAGLEKHLKHILQIPFTVKVAQLGLARGISNPISFLKLSPDETIGALDFDNNLATAMADRLMGGQARSASRPAGDLETRILAPVVQVFAGCLTHALRHQGAVVSTFQDEDVRVDAGLQIAIEFDIDGLKGAVRVILPNLFVDLDLAPTQGEFRPRDWVIELGKTEISAQALLDLKVGQIVKLDRHADANLVLVAGDCEFIGRPVLDGDRLLFSIAGARAEMN